MEVDTLTDRSLFEEIPGRTALDRAYCKSCKRDAPFARYLENYTGPRGVYGMLVWRCRACKSEHPTKGREQAWPK